jgi:uncharacterized protein YbaP (TraB family)
MMRALLRGVAVVGLETGQEQLEALAGMPLDLQVKQLIEILGSTQTAEDAQETIVQIYLSRRIGLFLVDDLKGSFPWSHYRDETFIRKRNTRMIESALPLLAKGGVFVAVGAAHLPGERGLVELVRKAGYTVTPIE